MKLSRRGLFAAMIGAPVALPSIALAAAAQPGRRVDRIPADLANTWGVHLNERLALMPRLSSDYVSK